MAFHGAQNRLDLRVGGQRVEGGANCRGGRGELRGDGAEGRRGAVDGRGTGADRRSSLRGKGVDVKGLGGTGTEGGDENGREAHVDGFVVLLNEGLIGGGRMDGVGSIGLRSWVRDGNVIC